MLRFFVLRETVVEVMGATGAWGACLAPGCVPSLSPPWSCTEASPQQWPHCGYVVHCCSGLGAACCRWCQNLCLGFVPGMLFYLQLCVWGGGATCSTCHRGCCCEEVRRRSAASRWPLARCVDIKSMCLWSGLSLTAVLCENCLQNKACFGF